MFVCLRFGLCHMPCPPVVAQLDRGAGRDAQDRLTHRPGRALSRWRLEIKRGDESAEETRETEGRERVCVFLACIRRLHF